MNESWLVEKAMLTSNNEVSFHKWVPELVSGGLQKSRLTLVEKGLIVALYSNYGVSPVGGFGTKYQAAHLISNTRDPLNWNFYLQNILMNYKQNCSVHLFKFICKSARTSYDNPYQVRRITSISTWNALISDIIACEYHLQSFQFAI